MNRRYNFTIFNREKITLDWGDTESKVEITEYNFSDMLYFAFLQKKKDHIKKCAIIQQALSDFLRLLLEKSENIIIEKNKLINRNALLYAVVLPSEWDEEIKDLLIRPVLTSAGLISEKDHQDLVLFVSDVEAIAYYLQDPFYYKDEYYFKRRQNTIMCRFIAINCNTALIKLDLISTMNNFFDIPGSMLFPNVVKSNSITITSDDIKHSIEEFLRVKLSSIGENHNLQIIVHDVYNNMLLDVVI